MLSSVGSWRFRYRLDEKLPVDPSRTSRICDVRSNLGNKRPAIHFRAGNDRCSSICHRPDKGHGLILWNIHDFRPKSGGRRAKNTVSVRAVRSSDASRVVEHDVAHPGVLLQASGCRPKVLLHLPYDVGISCHGPALHHVKMHGCWVSRGTPFDVDTFRTRLFAVLSEIDSHCLQGLPTRGDKIPAVPIRHQGGCQFFWGAIPVLGTANVGVDPADNPFHVVTEDRRPLRGVPEVELLNVGLKRPLNLPRRGACSTGKADRCPNLAGFRNRNHVGSGCARRCSRPIFSRHAGIVPLPGDQRQLAVFHRKM